MEKLSHYHSGIPVELVAALEHLLVGIKFRAMLKFSIWQIVHLRDSYMPMFLKLPAKQSCPIFSPKFATDSFLDLPSNVYRLKNSIQNFFFNY